MRKLVAAVDALERKYNFAVLATHLKGKRPTQKENDPEIVRRGVLVEGMSKQIKPSSTHPKPKMPFKGSAVAYLSQGCQSKQSPFGLAVWGRLAGTKKWQRFPAQNLGIKTHAGTL